MILAVHQPIFLPWPGFFHKAVHADCLVLLDDVQFPRGRSWLNRNRLKNEDGELWLTVPVLKKGRGLQVIRRVEIQNDKGWRKKHLGSIRQNYVHAPYFSDYFPTVESIYERGHSLLAELNVDLIEFFWDAFSVTTRLVRQSELGIVGKGTDLLIQLAHQVGADRLLVFPMVEKHIDLDAMRKHTVETVHAGFHPPVYPQLWGDFVYNLSTLDLLLNCGSQGKRILR
ncbi:MAG: WbqC family protein [Candidatus Latescibacterota bacterium]|nr:MAG: WbqC family protein [Candidatus Latescibacterota bacterium]